MLSSAANRHRHHHAITIATTPTNSPQHVALWRHTAIERQEFILTTTTTTFTLTTITLTSTITIITIIKTIITITLTITTTIPPPASPPPIAENSSPQHVGLWRHTAKE